MAALSAGNVQHLFGGDLHAGRQLVALNSRRQVLLARMPIQMLAVEPIEIGQISALRRTAQLRRRIQVQEARLLRANDGPLVQRREPAVLPVLDAQHGQSCRVTQHDEGRQVLTLGTRAHRYIHEPRAGRPAAICTRVECRDRLPVIVDVGVHRANQADVVGHLAQVGHQLAQLHAALAMLREFPRAAKQLGAGFGDIVVLDVAREGLQVPLSQLGLGVEQIDMAGAALHEHRDHRPCLRRHASAVAA